MAWPKQQRGRPSCPCGFVGGTRNIVAHRLSCPAWNRWVRPIIEKEILRLELDAMVARGELVKTADGKYALP